jgi:FRG domain-containing protein
MEDEPRVSVDTSSSQCHLFVRRVETWDALQAEFSYCGEWAFRGHGDASWSVRCNLDRKRGSIDPVHAESRVSQEFQRTAHLFLPTSREPETQLEWLSLIQHHGGPTRLIDFTRSPLIATFFALEEDTDSEEQYCAVWAVDEYACRRRVVERLRAIDPDYSWLREYHNIEGAVNARLPQPAQRFVAPIQPSRLNARMALQQGIFMCLGDPGSDLFGNLSPEVEQEPPLQIVKIEFPSRMRSEVLWALRRLGITRQTLFPGLDGLAQSLAHLLVPRNENTKALLHLLRRPSGWPGPSS